MNKILICLSAAFIAVLTACGYNSGSDESSYTRPLTAWEAVPSAEKTIETAVITESKEKPTEAETSASDAGSETEEAEEEKEKGSLLSSVDDIEIQDSGDGSNYTFVYNNEEFHAVYTPDNWKIYDSYRVENINDIKIICEALISIEPIHNADGNGYRNADDLAFEWNEHNKAYRMLSDDSKWKENTKDVDLDPKDQGKSMADMAFDRLKGEDNNE